VILCERRDPVSLLRDFWASSDLPGQHARTPMRGVRGLFLGGHGDDPKPHRVADTRFSGFRSLSSSMKSTGPLNSRDSTGTGRR